MKTFFKKLEHRFLVETNKIENTSIPFKTALSEANVKTNRMTTTKWTYHKEWSFASNYVVFFWKICSSFRTSQLDVPAIQTTIFVFSESAGVRVLFPCEYP